MLREEFEDITFISELSEFCYEHHIEHYIENIESADSYYEWIRSECDERISYDDLSDFRDWLDEQMDNYANYEYFYRSDYENEYCGMSDDGNDYYFRQIKDDILDECPELFDDYEDEDEEETDSETGEVIARPQYDYDSIDIDAPTVSDEDLQALSALLF